MMMQEAAAKLVEAGVRRYEIQHVIRSSGPRHCETEGYEISVCNSHISRAALEDALGTALEIVAKVRADNERLSTPGYCL